MRSLDRLTTRELEDLQATLTGERLDLLVEARAVQAELDRRARGSAAKPRPPRKAKAETQALL